MTKKQLLLGTFVIGLTIIVGLMVYLLVIFAGNYVIDDKRLVMDSASSILDGNGELITKLYIENREIVSIQDIPEHVQQAFVAVEDNRFYSHQGIDFRAIGRALYRDILAGAKVEGGSTITQQLAKNTFLTNEKTWLRKTKEVLIAMNLERQYSKPKILEMYLNRIYFGHGAYGIETASKLYFNKSVNELTIEEGALLAGLPKAPNNYSPINEPNRSKQRRDLVLSLMERHGYLLPEETVRLQGKVISLSRTPINNKDAFTTYIDMVLDEAEERYNLSNEEVLRGGYTIVVPMNQQLQEVSYKKFQEDTYFPANNSNAQAAFILMDVETGGILAVQGGRNYVQKGINRVNVKRQPGSVMKPIAVFAPSLEEGLVGPYSMLKDELLEYQGYRPRNFNHQYQGEVTMYEAIKNSVNAPSVWLLNELGIDNAKKYLERSNLFIEDEGLSIALGGLHKGLTPLEIIKAYRPFASNGQYIDHHFITEIYDQNGKLIGKASPEQKEVYSQQTAWYMTRMLESVVTDGTASRGYTNQSLAGKTGTTSFTEVQGGVRDAWFVGYTPTVVGTVWMGYDVTNSEQYLQGGSAYPTVLFKEILNELPTGLQSMSFTKPENVVDLENPIQLVKINDLSASVTLGGKGLFGAKLTWTPSNDERLYYNIYEVKDYQMNMIDTVQGVGEFLVGPINIFSTREYLVVPYNSLTDREGSPSNVAPVKFNFGF